MAISKTQVSQLYVAIFGRASEGEGNTFWQLSSSSTATTADLMFAQSVVKTYFNVTDFTSEANVRTVVETIYLNALGKGPTEDPTGIQFWVDSVIVNNDSIGTMAAALTSAATTAGNAGVAQDTFNNKVAVSNHTADTIQTFTNFAQFQGYIAGVDNTPASVTAAEAAVDADVPASSLGLTLVAATNSVTEGNSIAFTVTADHAPTVDTPLNYQISGASVAGGTADPLTDLGVLTGSVTILAGTTTATITLTPIDDQVTEGFEGFKVNLLDSNFTTVASSAVVTIQDGANSGQTFTLTKNLDNFSGVGAGTVKGVISGVTSGDTTWGVADTVTGGTAGSTLDLTAVVGDDVATTTQSVSTVGRSTNGIENFDIRFVDADNIKAGKLTIDANTLTGAQKFNIISASASASATVTPPALAKDTIDFANLLKTQTVAVKSSDADLNIDLSYKSGQDASANDTATINFEGGKADTVKVNGNFETIKVIAAGNASAVTKIDASGNKLKAVDVEGTGDITIKEIGGYKTSSAHSFNAANATGKVTATLNANSKLTATGGTGTADTLNLDVATSVATGMSVSNFENVNLKATSAATVALDLITGAQHIGVNGSTASGSISVLTMTKAAANAGIHFVGTGKNEIQKFNGVTYTLANATGTSDSVDISFANNGVAVSSSKTASTGLITAANIETVNVSVSDFAKVDSSLAIANAKTLTLTGAATLDLSPFTASNALETINAGGYSGKLTWGTLGTAITGNLTYTGSTGADSLTTAKVADSKTQTFNLGTGNDKIIIDQLISGTGTGISIVNGEDGDDEFTVSLADSAATAIDHIKLAGGAGNDTLTITGADNASDAVTFEAFSGIEALVLSNFAATATTTFKVADGYKETMNITDVSGQAITLDFKAAAAGGKVDLSHLTFLGWTDVMKLTGSTGNETLIGSSKADTITGGAGADTITGGAGADTFVYTTAADSGITTATADIIADFVTTTDRLKVGVVGTAANFFELNATTTVGDDVATVELAVAAANTATGVGTSFDGTVQFMFVSDFTGGVDGYLVADNNLDGNADFAVELTGLNATANVVFGDIIV